MTIDVIIFADVCLDVKHWDKVSNQFIAKVLIRLV